MSKFKVKIAYKNKNLLTILDKTYSLDDYLNMIKTDITRVIMDVEDYFYVANDCKSKDDWNKETMMAFQKIRHKLLDNANAIGRITDNLYFEDTPYVTLSSVLADIINKKK